MIFSRWSQFHVAFYPAQKLSILDRSRLVETKPDPLYKGISAALN
jgi:hypothetical protein